VTAAALDRSTITRAASAAGWVVLGRALGLGWTVLLVARLSVADYGVYAMSFALAAIVAVPVDNLFHVRSVRVGDAEFLRERSGRGVVGIAIALAGAAAFAIWPPLGFALVVAGGEIAFNALKSSALRTGQPQRTMRWDAARQAASIALGAAAVLVPAHPGLALTAALYAAPYGVVAVLVAVRCLRHRPSVGGTARERGLLALEALGLGVYLQGDVLVLGLVAGSAVAGVYSIGSLVALAAASLAQVFVQTYTERLRLGRGRADAGPARAVMAVLAVAIGLAVAALGGVVALIPGEGGVAIVLVAMAAFAALRSGSTMLTAFLYAQGRDGHRVAASCVAAVVKLGAIVLIGRATGAVGAAIAVTAVEAGVLAWFGAVVARAPRAVAATDAGVEAVQP
jgi:O-antigen/teichoic acid export membrane protein